MTVKELILALAQFPPHLNVLVRDFELGDVDIAEAYSINTSDVDEFVRIRTSLVSTRETHKELIAPSAEESPAQVELAIQ